MTEIEWLNGSDPDPMVEFLRDKVSERKLRLALCAGCRQLPSLVDGMPAGPALEAAERLADGLLSRKELRRIRRSVLDSLVDDMGWRAEDADFMLDRFGGFHLDDDPAWASRMAVSVVTMWLVGETLSAFRLRQALRTLAETQPADRRVSRREECRQGQCQAIREIVGNPIRPAPMDASWLTATVTSMAQGIYQDQAFDRLPILADALQDAGCDNPDVLGHCRSDGPHARGCWVVDRLTGRT